MSHADGLAPDYLDIPEFLRRTERPLHELQH